MGVAEEMRPPGELLSSHESEAAPSFDGYQLGRLLGRGGMGEVYLATDTFLERTVAVKFLRDGAVTPERKDQFLAEARALARLQHPNVVSVYRVGETAGRPYLVSEWVRGVALDALEKPLAAEKVLSLGLGLARGLAAAHRRGVLHRDLKPANAILGDDGEVKLLDFGLAKLVQPSGAVREEPRAGAEAPFGSANYMAPEVWVGEPASFRSDVYGLGAVLYELCVGHAPHLDEVAEMIPEIAATPAEPVARLARTVSPALAEVIDRCLQVQPAARYGSAEELCAALERLAADTQRSPSKAAGIPEGNPYRGLQAFEAEHRSFFFGRDAEIRAILERLRNEPFILVAADSGVGKSSLCRAGVLPEVVGVGLGDGRQWSSITLTPGQHPLEAITAALAPWVELSEGELAERLSAEGASIGRELRKHLGKSRGLILFIDQMEELTTLSKGAEALKTGELLSWLAASTPGVRLLATVRSDFLTRVAAVPGIGNDVSRALFLLKPLSAENIREAIKGPAAAKGVRFEPESMVNSLVEAAASAEGGLPLLQFALAELWERRDVPGARITGQALEEMGGVMGALARHADGVLAALRPGQAASARRMLPLLVTMDGTRARRSEQELVAGQRGAQEVLDALVRARLLVAREASGGSAYEVAHEALIRGWPTLRQWLEEDADRRAARERLSQAAADWVRLGRGTEGLWAMRLQQQVAFLEPAGLTPEELDFLDASRRWIRRGRLIRAGGASAALLALAVLYAVMRVRADNELKTRIAEYTREAAVGLTAARQAGHALAQRRQEAFALFDAVRKSDAEAAWEKALKLQSEVDHQFARVTQTLETALTLDRTRRELRYALAEALLERSLFAEASRRFDQRDELVARLGLYDENGAQRSRLAAPAVMELSAPAGARVVLQRFEVGARQRLELHPVRTLGTTPLPPVRLQPGSYVLDFALEGRAPVRLPLVLTRGESTQVSVELPPLSSVPLGFVYVPAGRFLFGSGGEDSLRRDFLNTSPLHPVELSGYLISRHETTYQEWVAFLEAQAPDERARRTPRVSRENERGSLVLKVQPGGKHELVLQPTERKHSAQWGKPLSFERSVRQEQDWRRLPVTGISADDARAYLAWLHQSGRVPGARLCTEVEWERAAKGADGREYPHANQLASDEANFDETYGKKPGGFGPDEVGTYPASRSPFGLDDMVGNAWEWTQSRVKGEYVAKGGSFYYGRNSARAANREITEASLRDVSVGLRACADLPPQR